MTNYLTIFEWTIYIYIFPTDIGTDVYISKHGIHTLYWYLTLNIISVLGWLMSELLNINKVEFYSNVCFDYEFILGS